MIPQACDHVRMPGKRPSALASRAAQLMEKASEFVRFDGWVNALTGLGGIADKRLFARFQRPALLPDGTLADLYHYNWLARLVCELVVRDSMAKGYKLQIPDGDKLEAQIAARMSELCAWDRMADAAVWGRVFGGGALLLGVEDGQGWEQPLNFDTITRVNMVTALDKRSLHIMQWYSDPRDPKFCLPEFYRLQRVTNGRVELDVAMGQLIHESRLIVWGGSRTADQEKQVNAGWDHSVLQLVSDVLRDHGAAFAGASTLLQEASQAVYKIKDLMRTLASDGGEEALTQRYRMIEMGRSISKAIVMDLEEDFERKPTSFTSIPEMLDRIMEQVSAASRVPVTKLIGRAPAGLNATGDADSRNWESECVTWQTHELTPRLEVLIRALLCEAGQEPKEWTLSFPQVATETPLQTAQLRKAYAEIDQINIMAGIYLPEDASLARYGAEGFSTELTIDPKFKTALLEIKEESALESAQAGGDPSDLGTAGAQVDALQKITDAVAAGTISQETGVARVVALFNVTEEQASQMLGEIAVTPPPAPADPNADPEADALDAQAAAAVGEEDPADGPKAV